MTKDDRDTYRGIGVLLLLVGLCLVGGALFGKLGVGISLIVVGWVFVATAVHGGKDNNETETDG